MKNFNQKLLAVLILCCCLYGGFRVYDSSRASRGTLPEIQAPEEALLLSVGASDQDMLRGVTASDKEDGNLNRRIFLESLSPLDENGQRTATYGVFDSDDNVARTSRKLQYTDYQPPQFSLTGAMVFDESDLELEALSNISAASVLDGDLSGQVIISDSQEESGMPLITFSVTDSAGQRSDLTLKVSLLQNTASYQIGLTDYLLRVKPGTRIDPEDYVDSVTRGNIDYSDLADDIEIRTDYDPKVPGMYEFIYQLQRPNGDFGMTKLVVIVE